MKQKLQLSNLSELLKQYPGRYFLENEQTQLNRLLSSLHGFFLVQLGIIDSYDLKSASTITHRVYVGRSAKPHSNLSMVEANFTELPFQSESIDVFVLPHTLEFVTESEKILSEIYHCLIPGGKVIILGFNPFSLLGLSRISKSANNTPWCGKLRRMGNIKNLLNTIGFSVEYHKTFCFLPSSNKESSGLSRFEFVLRLFPMIGSDYIIVAEKKIIPLSPVKLKIHTKKISVTRGFPEPSTNKSSL